MIVPRMRLVVVAGMVLLPSGCLTAWRPDLTDEIIALAAAVLLVTILDAWLSRGRLRELVVELPDVVRLTVGHEGQLPVQIDKPRSLATRLRVGLALPRDIASVHPEVTVLLEDGPDRVGVCWTCRALRRGRFAVTRCYLETGSRIGLWGIRRALPLHSELRAYPDIVSSQQHLRGLFQRRQWGLRTQRRLGKGREFEELREYLPGDSFEDIDWKATARRRYPVTKVFQVERSQEIYVLLDASRLSTRSAAYPMDRRRLRRAEAPLVETTIFERYIAATLVMAVVAERLGDRFGLLVFSEKPDIFIKAGRGRTHYNACRDALYNRMPHTVSPDFNDLFTFVGTHLRKRALLVFLTSLDDPMLSESFIHAMQGASRQHILMVNMFRPPGAYPLFTTPDIRNVQGIYQHLVGHMLWSSIDETRRQLRQRGSALHLLNKDQHCSQLVSQYMEIKQRQLL
jgi:uncharacterized protein (DUF58 family)